MNTLRLLEYEIVENCNLNCKNCSHFSQFKQKNIKPIEKIEEDLKRVCDKYHLITLNVSGGEPLLHPNIVNVLSSIRKIVGDDTKIKVTTNGIKVLSMHSSFFLALKYLKINIKTSRYSINVDYDKIKMKFEEYGIPYNMGDEITHFRNLVDASGSYDASESFQRCKNINLACPMYDGQNIYICTYASNVKFLNEKFRYNIETNGVSIDEPPEVIINYLNSPCSTCKFCHVDRKPEKWKLENEK